MPSCPDQSDDEMMDRIQRGDVAALDQLFVRHHRRLYGFLARMTGDTDAADDLVQELFLRVLRLGRSYHAGSGFRPWAFRIARNLLADRHRLAAATVDADLSDVASDAPLPLDDLIAAERAEQLANALARLPAAHREVLLLRGTEGLTHRELALALDCSEGAARVRVHRALNALKAACHSLAGEPR